LWGVTTQKGNKVYVHVLDWQDSALLVPRLPRPLRSAAFLKDGSRAEYVENRDGVLLRIPPSAREDYDTVAVLELAEK
jgi:alpha-L-fucosidase